MVQAGDHGVEIGAIVRRHGVRGEVRVLPHNPLSEALEVGQRVELVGADGATQWRKIESLRPHKRFYLVFFDGVTSADQADLLVGARVVVPRDALPELDDDEVYWFDLIGCDVQGESGEEFGRVVEMMATGSNDVLVVREGDAEHLIPWIDDVIVSWDHEQSKIVIRVLPGLLVQHAEDGG